MVPRISLQARRYRQRFIAHYAYDEIIRPGTVKYVVFQMEFYAVDFGMLVQTDDPRCVYDLHEVAPRIAALPRKVNVL